MTLGTEPATTVASSAPRVAREVPLGGRGSLLAALWWVVPLAWVAGVATQLYQPRLWPVGMYMSFCASALVCIGFVATVAVVGGRRKQGLEPTPDSPLGPAAVGAVGAARAEVALAVALVAAVAVCGAASTGWRAAERQQQVLAPAFEGHTWWVTGQVADLPRATPSGWRFEFELESMRWVSPPGETLSLPLGVLASPTGPPGQPAAMPKRVVLAWVAADASGLPRAGERWRLPVRLRAPHGAANPHGFDTELWMWTQGLGASGSVRLGAKDPLAQRFSPAPWGWLALRANLRDRLAARVPDAREAGVLSALVVGDQSAIERADWDIFRTTGVAHLFSISGLHITLWAWLVRWAVVRLWRGLPRWWPVVGARVLLACPAPVAAAWGGWSLALAYAVFSGWGVPAQRTVLMLGVVLGLGLLGRRWPWPVVGVVTMAAVLAWDPWAWLQPGFWLSFVAVGVLLAAERPRPGAGWWAAARDLLRTQWRMTLVLAPLTLALFGQVSVVGLLANLVAIPVVTVAVTPLALAGALWPGLWVLASWLVGVVLGLLQVLATWPWASLDWPAAPWPLALLAVVGGCVAVLHVPATVRGLGVVLVLPVLLWQPERAPPGAFEVLAADVGQGAAVLIRTASGSVLYDAGPQWGPDTDAGARLLVPLLRALGERPGHVVLSHADGDHVGGALSVLAHLQGQPGEGQGPQVWASFDPADVVSGLSNPALARPWLAQLPNAAPGAWRRCMAGGGWVQDGVRFDFLYPDTDGYTRPSSTNNRSCVLRVSGAHGTALLTGDLDASREAALVALSPDLRADWLLAPHHGSRSSSSDALVQAVQPRWVVAQAGRLNRYGHPAPEVVARYLASGAQWRATPECGAARWRSDQAAQLSCHRAQYLRYWHWQDAP